MAQNAKSYAREQLGNLDLSYLKGEEDVANRTYGTTKNALQTNFNNLLNQITSNREDTRKNFNTGRATVAENAYAANRQNMADLASRGIGSSGLKILGEVGNRMETGKQYSNLANKFYSTMTDLDNTEKQSRDQYNIDLQTAKNTLDNALAGINSRRGEAQNNYNMALGQLAEQVQSRWDANANAKASLALQKEQIAQAKAAAAQSHADAIASAKQQLQATNRNNLINIVNSDATVDAKRVAIQTTFGVDANTANSVLSQLGLTTDKSLIGVGSNIMQPYASGKAPSNVDMNKIYKILGID